MGIKVLRTKFGCDETLQLPYPEVVRLLIEAYGLTEFAETGSDCAPILIIFTADGAKPTEQDNHVSAGCIFRDGRCLNPLTGDPHWKTCKVQSVTQCVVIKTTMAKEKKETYRKLFGDVFNFIKNLNKDSFTASHP